MITVKVSGCAGGSIEDYLFSAKAFADRNECMVDVNVNGVKGFIGPNTNVNDLISQYHNKTYLNTNELRIFR